MLLPKTFVKLRVSLILDGRVLNAEISFVWFRRLSLLVGHIFEDGCVVVARLIRLARAIRSSAIRRIARVATLLATGYEQSGRSKQHQRRQKFSAQNRTHTVMGAIRSGHLFILSIVRQKIPNELNRFTGCTC